MPSVNPRIMVWARETAGLDLHDAADKLSLTTSKNATAVDKLTAFEKGEQEPSRSILKRMAKHYRRPILTFYLEKPPKSVSRGEDFRTLSQEADPSQHAIVDALLRNVRARQEIIKDALLSEQDSETLQFVGSYKMSQGVAGLVSSIKNYFRIDIDFYRSRKTQSDAFAYLRDSIENSGIYALLIGNLGSHHSNIDTNIFRGFSLADDIAPFIVINDQDAKSAWSVTLLHEVAHLWLGHTGLSANNAQRRVELFCDQVASEILISKEELEAINFFSQGNHADTIKIIDDHAHQFKVSSSLIAFRLLKTNKIDQDFYTDLREHFRARWANDKKRARESSKTRAGGPSYYVVRRHKLGTALVNASERLLRSGELSTTKAAAVLGVRALKLDKMLSDQRRA